MNEQVSGSVARSGRERRVSPIGRGGLADLGRDTGGQGEGAPREEVAEGMGCYW